MGDAFKMTRVRMEIAMEHGNESVLKKAIAVIDETKFNSGRHSVCSLIIIF